jgi:hypothetical protein
MPKTKVISFMLIKEVGINNIHDVTHVEWGVEILQIIHRFNCIHEDKIPQVEIVLQLKDDQSWLVSVSWNSRGTINWDPQVFPSVNGYMLISFGIPLLIEVTFCRFL